MSATATIDIEPVRTRRSVEASPVDAPDGDAAVLLEELVEEELPFLEGRTGAERTIEIELVGLHLRVAGSLAIGYHRRLSDFVNDHLGLLQLREVTVLRRNGEPTRVHTPSLWASPEEVTLIAQPEAGPPPPVPVEFRIPKVSRTLVVVTPGHTLTGEVHIPTDAELDVFIESPDPRFVPMTDVRTRSLADRRVVARYDFALLNRRHIVAATELQPGMIPGRRVL